MKCFVCGKELEIRKEEGCGSRVMGGMYVHLDIDEGSSFYKAKPERWGEFLKKLISCNTITGVICDDCFEMKHRYFFGTEIELKRTYKDYYADGTIVEIPPKAKNQGS